MRTRSWLVIAKVRPSLVREHVTQMNEDSEALAEDSNWYAQELLQLVNSDCMPKMRAHVEASNQPSDDAPC
jgi:hypothetical protein